MRLGLVIVALVAACAAPAQAARVDVMVVGKREVLLEPRSVRLEGVSVDVGRRSCRVAAATPLAALARTPVRRRLVIRDYGACSRRARDATGLYVRGIGREVERGRDGWVYKIGRRTPGAGAGDVAAGLRGGRRLLWFWCRSRAAGCQRTLEATPDRDLAAPGETLRVTVTAHDDAGRGVPAAGATVRLGPATARADEAGVATLVVPAGSATLSAVATRDGMVRSFPARVRVA